MRPSPPGRLIDAGGHRLHLRATGRGSPVVVLDAALGGSSVSWTFVQPAVAEFTRVVAYDRAGFGWSDPGPLPRTAGRIADELVTALTNAGEPPPYLLVGHSFGGLVARIVASRYRDEVAGLVLVDPAHPEDWVRPAAKEQARIDRGVRLCRQGYHAARWGVAHAVSALVGLGAIRPARKLADLASRGDIAGDTDWLLAPLWKLPAAERHVLRWFWTKPRFFEALGSQIEHIHTSAAETLDSASGGYGDLPLVTISSTDPGEYRLRQQEALAALSTRGRHVVANASGHWIPLDEPGTVVSAIRDLCAAFQDSLNGGADL